MNVIAQPVFFLPLSVLMKKWIWIIWFLLPVVTSAQDSNRVPGQLIVELFSDARPEQLIADLQQAGFDCQLAYVCVQALHLDMSFHTGKSS